MASVAVICAVSAHLAANWTHCPVVHPNQASQPPADGSPFLLVQYPPSQESRKSFGAPGANLYREEGTFRLILLVPPGTGLEAWVPWLDEARALFRGAVIDGVRCGAPSSVVADTDANQANRWALSTAVPYQVDLFG